MHVGYTTDPQNVPFCENQPVLTMFAVTYRYNSTSFLPNWLVTQLASMSDRTIIPGETSGPFIPQGRALPGEVAESTITVNSQEVTATTCFQCVISTIGGGNFRSNQGCVTALGERNAQKYSSAERGVHTLFMNSLHGSPQPHYN